MVAKAGFITLHFWDFFSVYSLFRLGPKKFYEKSSTLDAGTFNPPTDEEIIESYADKIDTYALWFSVFMLISGTFLSGYGDIIYKILIGEISL